MKMLIALIALAMPIAAAATDTYQIGDMTLRLEHRTVRLDDTTRVATALVTVRFKGRERWSRHMLTVTGCGQGFGRWAIDEGGETPRYWVSDGPTAMDEIAGAVCLAGIVRSIVRDSKESKL